jgi:hypothetical protein
MQPSLRIAALSALLLAALLPDGAESYGMATCSKPASAEMAWKDLSKKEKKAARALGFDFATWNFEKVLNQGSETLPEWKELSKTEKRVAQAQGWNWKSWKANPCDSDDCEQETEFCFRGQCLDTSDNDTCDLISSLGRTDDGWGQSYLAQEDSNWQCPGGDEHGKRERRNGDDFPIRPTKDDWADLHWTAKSAAKQLGWTDETFDGCICTHADTAFGDKSWEELNWKELKAIKILGYNECSWSAEDYDSVKLTQKKWEELSLAETDALKQLGLSKFKWNSCVYAQEYKEYSPKCYAKGGISSPEIRRNWGKTKLWNALSWKQKKAAKNFGFTQDSWDKGYDRADYNGDGEWEMAWGGLSHEQQTAAGTLGWVQKTWDCEEDESALCIPDSIKKDYCQLTDIEKKNVRRMGLKPMNWDMRGELLMEMPWGGAEIYTYMSMGDMDSAPMDFGKSYKGGKRNKWVKAAKALGWTNSSSWTECQSRLLWDSEWSESESESNEYSKGWSEGSLEGYPAYCSDTKEKWGSQCTPTAEIDCVGPSFQWVEAGSCELKTEAECTGESETWYVMPITACWACLLQMSGGYFPELKGLPNDAVAAIVNTYDSARKEEMIAYVEGLILYFEQSGTLTGDDLTQSQQLVAYMAATVRGGALDGATLTPMTDMYEDLTAAIPGNSKCAESESVSNKWSEGSEESMEEKVTCDGYTTDQFCDCSDDCDVHADTWCGCEVAQADDCCGMNNNTSAGSLEGPGP